MFAEQISDMIEEEVQRRLAVYIKTFADHFFTTEAELYKVIKGKGSVAPSFCKGRSRNGKACRNKGKHEHDGYCHLHKGQKPKQRKQQPPRDEMTSTSSSTNEQVRPPPGIVDEIF